MDNLVEQYTELLGSQNEAIKRVCLKWDIYFSESTLNSSKKIDAGRSRIKTYIKNCNLVQNAGKTYDTYLREIDTGLISSMEELEELKEKGNLTLTTTSIERWGIGCFSNEEYKTLDDHYKMLKKANPNCDSNQEIFIKSLCHLNLLQFKALKDNNTKGYIEVNSEYAKTFKQAGLKTLQDGDKNADDCWGVFMEQISQYTPEEYYKDKTLYKDFDGIEELFNRFVLRPLKNLLCKTNERDKEFNVEEISNE